LIGKGVKGGLHGPLPNLTDLTDGDLKFSIDFRQVYSAAIEDWIGGDAQPVFGQTFPEIGVFKS
jgi:uncharacterized protein (DUF1501 family)